MDINALYSRDLAYFSQLVDANKLTTYLPEFDTSIPSSFSIAKLDSSVETTILAPYNPTTSQSVSQIQVIEKASSNPASYSVVWTSTDTATLTPTPVSVSTGDTFRIGTSLYDVLSVTGSQVQFTVPVSEVAVFYANVATPEVSYQWQVSEDAGITWVNIAGATSRVYEPEAGDVGDDLRVLISYVDGQGTIEAPTLAPPSTQPGLIFPVYPIIADIQLDVVREYKANLLTELIIKITST